MLVSGRRRRTLRGFGDDLTDTVDADIIDGPIPTVDDSGLNAAQRAPLASTTSQSGGSGSPPFWTDLGSVVGGALRALTGTPVRTVKPTTSASSGISTGVLLLGGAAVVGLVLYLRKRG